MKLPNFRRLFSSDFKPEWKQLIDQIGILFNGNFEPLYNALNNNLTFKENFACTIAEFTVSVDVDGVPNQTTTLRMSNNQNTVSGIIVISAIGGNFGTVMPEAGVYVDAIKDGDLLTIRYVKGLQVGTSYRVKAIVLA